MELTLKPFKMIKGDKVKLVDLESIQKILEADGWVKEEKPKPKKTVKKKEQE